MKDRMEENLRAGKTARKIEHKERKTEQTERQADGNK